FDPVTQHEYYSLQAVFAAVDRADRPYDPDPEIHRERTRLLAQQQALAEAEARFAAIIQEKVGTELSRIDAELASLDTAAGENAQPQFGYHSGIELIQDTIKW